MNEQPGRWEEQLRQTARAFDYPPTPDLAPALRRRLERPARARPRRWAGAALILLLLSGLLAVPQVRARIQEWLRIGTVRVSVLTPTPPPAVPPADALTQSPATALPASEQPATATPARPLALLNAGGETTLEAARQAVPFAIPLPAEPGPPDHVFLPDPAGHAVVLVWLDPQQTEQVSLSLHILDSEIWAQKMLHSQPESLSVNGADALWMAGAHEIFLFDPRSGTRYTTPRLVPGNTLLWAADGLTYRLETGATRAEALRLAESLR